MVSHIARMTGAAAVLALLVLAGATHTPRSAQAAIPAPCPAGVPVAASDTYRIFATLPVGVPAQSGVCVTLSGASPIGSGSVIQAPCPPVTASAATSGGQLIWADFGAACVASGQTVILEFKGPPGLTLGIQPGAAHWTGGIVGDATVWPTVAAPVPAACPLAGPGPAGAVPLKLVAHVPPIPAGAMYDGVCISFPIGPISVPAAVTGPAGCPTAALAPPPPAANPVVGSFFSLSSLAAANDNMLWVDWTQKCATPPGTLTMFFRGPAALLGVCAGCATWLDGAVTSDVTVSLAASVGGIAAAPDTATLPAARASGGSSVDERWYGGVAGIALLLVIGAGARYARRRRPA